MKFALVSHVLPPSWSGQAVVIYRLLKGLDPRLYCLLSRQDYRAGDARPAYAPELPATYYHLRPAFRIRRGYRFGLHIVREVANVLLEVVSRGRQIANVARGEACDAIVACTGDLIDPPAGLLASRILRVPYFPYIFDSYSYREIDPLQRWIAHRLERFIMRGAECPIVPNEFVANDLSRRFGVSSTIIRNPCDMPAHSDGPPVGPTEGNREIKIVYTGAVYEAHYDAFRNLLAALDLLSSLGIRLHVFSAITAARVAQVGIKGAIVWHDHEPIASVPTIQRSADLLFLPLAFNSPYPEVIRTSSPGKMGEYLASRRPILVHAPPDSFVAWYMRTHECGIVVDEPEPRALADAIERVLNDPALQEKVTSNAWARAQADFRESSVRGSFARLMKLDMRAYQLVPETDSLGAVVVQ